MHPLLIDYIFCFATLKFLQDTIGLKPFERIGSYVNYISYITVSTLCFIANFNVSEV